MIHDKKDKFLRVRLTSSDYEILKETAYEHGLSLSKYIRMLLDQAVLMIIMERKRHNGEDE